MSQKNTASNTDHYADTTSIDNLNDHTQTDDDSQSEVSVTITAHLVPDHERLSITADLFGFFFPMKLEPAIYHFADRLSEDYRGGYWTFYHLSNGGFYMAPDDEKCFKVSSMNGFEGILSADALGIAVCLYAYSHLSFGEGPFAESCAEHYHRLLDYACEHPEAGLILRVID
jgi:hypothetical protein